MNIFIDSDAITQGANSLTRAISNIEQCIAFILMKINAIGEEFTSINYFRTSTKVTNATNALSNMNEKLEIAKDFLDQVISIVERYNKLKY